METISRVIILYAALQHNLLESQKKYLTGMLEPEDGVLILIT